MDRKIIWSPRAAENLEDIYHYIAKDSRYYASLVVKRILDLVKTIPDQPLSGRIVPEYGDDSIREKFYSHYRIIYRIKDDVIEIAAIYHGARLLN